MNKEFIPYEQALALKELGFNQKCLGQYNIHQKDKWIFSLDLSGEGQYPSNSPACLAPTFSQAFRWFREKYLLFGYSFPNDYQNYGYRIVEMTSDENKELVYDWGTKDTYEEAELECLKKLIEIVKTK